VAALAALAALGVALLAEKLAEDERLSTQGTGAPPVASWLLFGLAGLALVVAAWPPPRLRPSAAPPFRAVLRATPIRRVFLGLLALALLCSLVSIPLFAALNADPEAAKTNWLVNTGSWLLYVASLVCYGAAFVVWERALSRELHRHQPSDAPDPRLTAMRDRLPRRVEWLIMAGLLLVALALRFVNLDSVPPGLWFDEAQNGVVARGLLAPGAAHLTFIAEHTQMGALYFYLLGFVQKVLGEGVWQLRVLPALAGALIAPMLYLLAARLYGWRAGLAAGGLVAVSAWNITLSRIGLVSMFTVALDVAAYLCVMQALRTGRLAYYAAGGVLLGLGLQMYYVARLVPVVLLVLLAHLLITERMRLVRAVRAGALVFVLSVALAFLPVAVFAVQHPDVYNSRISTVSIFSQEGGNGRPDAFWLSLSKHLLMFNFLGDMNGRHNLPGRPMLDWLTAALFFGGLASCLLRVWRWHYFFPVAWFMAAISGGVLSLLFEAPQAHRTIENSVVTALIAGIFLGECWQALSRALVPASAVAVQWPAAGGAAPPHPHPLPLPAHRPFDRFPAPAPMAASIRSSVPVRRSPVPAPQTVTAHDKDQPSPAGSHLQAVPAQGLSRRVLAMYAGAVGILVCIWLAGSINAYRYFELQAGDRGVWKEMYAPETYAARVAARYGDSRDIYIAPLYYNLPPMNYLAPSVPVTEWPGLQVIPFGTAARDIVLVLDPGSVADLSMIARIYPNATFEQLVAPSDPTPLAYTIYIPASDVQSLHGVRATLYAEGSSTPLEDATVPMFHYDRGGKQLTPGTLRLSATLKVDRFGSYRFEWQSAEGPSAQSRLLVDGFELSAGQPVSLGVGLHSLVVTETIRVGGTGQTGVSRLLWTPPEAQREPVPPHNLFDPRKVEPRGLTALLRKGAGFDTEPVDGRVDPVISFYFQRTPLSRPYTIEWQGRLYVPQAGLYSLGTEQISTTRLYVDGKEVLVNTQSNVLMDVPVDLTEGWHDIRLLFQDLADYSHVYLYWTPPGGVRTIIPSAFLWPRMGQYPTQPESGPFPTPDEANGNRLPMERVTRVNHALIPLGVGGAPPPQGSPPTPNPRPPDLGTQPQPQPQPQPQSSASLGEPIEPLLVLGQSDQAGDRLNRPQAAAVDDRGNIYVLTIGDGKVHKYSAQGQLLTVWDVLTPDGKPATEASAMLFMQGHLYVLNSDGSELLEYTPDGELVGRKHLCDCYFPRGMAPSADGNLWVTDTGLARVLKVGADGTVLASIEGQGGAPGQFVEPAGVWEAPDGTLLVADIGNRRVQSFTPAPELKPAAQWHMGSSVARDGNRLTATPEGNVLVTQAEAPAIVMYDRQGKELRRWHYSPHGVPLVPAGIAPAGDDKYIVLFPNDGLGVLARLTAER
jgi:sugar lactone lactonase YvrE